MENGRFLYVEIFTHQTRPSRHSRGLANACRENDWELLLDYIRYFVIFEADTDKLIMKIAGYHQFHAVREAVRANVIAAQAPEQGHQTI